MPVTTRNQRMLKAFPRVIAAGALVIAGAACKTATPDPARVGAQPAGTQAGHEAAAAAWPGRGCQRHLPRARNPSAVQHSGRGVHVRHDPASRSGGPHRRMGRLARRAEGRRDPLRAHRRRPARRDPVHADLAERSRAGRARRERDAPQDEDAERHGARHAHAGHADASRSSRRSTRRAARSSIACFCRR